MSATIGSAYKWVECDPRRTELMNELERNEEDKLSNRDRMTGAILDRLLEGWATQQAYAVTRLNFKFRGNDWLVIIYRESKLAGEQVAFTQGKDLGSAVRTTYSLMVQDKLRWREPKKWD